MLPNVCIRKRHPKSKGRSSLSNIIRALSPGAFSTSLYSTIVSIVRREICTNCLAAASNHRTMDVFPFHIVRIMFDDSLSK